MSKINDCKIGDDLLPIWSEFFLETNILHCVSDSGMVYALSQWSVEPEVLVSSGYFSLRVSSSYQVAALCPFLAFPPVDAPFLLRGPWY